MFKAHWLWGCLLVLLTKPLLAANPVSVSPVPPAGFPPVVQVGQKVTVVYTFTLSIPRTITLIKNAAPAHEFTYVDTCSGKVRACTLTVHFTAVEAGDKALQIRLQDGASTTNLPVIRMKAAGVPQKTVTITGSAIDPMLPQSMNVNDTKPFKFEFRNTGTGDATGVSVTSANPDFSTDCVTPDNTTLRAGATCTASGTFTPVSANPGSQFVTATFSFNQGEPVVVKTAPVQINPPAITGKLEGRLVGDGLPGNMQLNETWPLIFEFKNTMQEPVKVTQKNDFKFFKETKNTCPTNNAPFPAGATCTIEGTFSASTLEGEPGVEAGLIPENSPPDPAIVKTHTRVYEGGKRSLTVSNKCPFDVWFSMNGSQIPDSQCQSNDDCNRSFPGSVCSITHHACFYANYGSEDPDDPKQPFKLKKSTGSAEILIQDTGSSTIWNGTISASTGCQGNQCKTASCGNNGGTTSCEVGVPFQAPATIGQITFMKNASDVYSVQVNKGFHIPIQIIPNGRTAQGYLCGSPGKPQPQGTSPGTIGACLWNTAQVPQPGQYPWVFGTTPCVENACPGNKVCGLNINLQNNKLQQVCGDFLGYWTADQACQKDPATAKKYFGCDTQIALPPPDEGTNVQYTQLYSCATNQSQLNSCYDDSATNSCCGCVNWQNIPGIIVPQNLAICKNPNPAPEPPDHPKMPWSQVVLPTVQWMKKACPSYSVYPFDTPSSTFGCTDSHEGSLNTQDYTITFCAGNSGLPGGKADGRGVP